MLLEPGFQGGRAWSCPRASRTVRREACTAGGLFPVLWGKGKRPAGGDELRQRFHDVSRQQTIGSDG